MNVVVDDHVAVLQVLSLTDAVRCDEHIDLSRLLRHEHVTLLRARGEQRERRGEVQAGSKGALRSASSRDQCGVQSSASESWSDVLIKILRSICEGGEHQHLAVALVQRLFHLL